MPDLYLFARYFQKAGHEVINLLEVTDSMQFSFIINIKLCIFVSGRNGLKRLISRCLFLLTEIRVSAVLEIQMYHLTVSILEFIIRIDPEISVDPGKSAKTKSVGHYRAYGS